MTSFSIQDLLGLHREDTPAAGPDGAAPLQPTPVSHPNPQRKRRRLDTDSVGNSPEESPSSESEESCPTGANCGEKPKRLRTAFTMLQLRGLEYAFRMCPYPDNYGREQIARATGIDETKIQVWFQNRRARYRKRERPQQQQQMQQPLPPYCCPNLSALPQKPSKSISPVTQSSPAAPQHFFPPYFPFPIPYYPSHPLPLPYATPASATSTSRPKKFTGGAKRSVSNEN